MEKFEIKISKETKVDDFLLDFPLETVMNVQMKIPVERLIDLIFEKGKDEALELVIGMIKKELFTFEKVNDLLLRQQEK